MMEQGIGKRLDGERGSLSHRNLDSQDPAGVEIEHGRHIDLLSVLYQLGEVRCPDVVCICGHDREEEVGIGPGNLGFSPFSASPAVGFMPNRRMTLCARWRQSPSALASRREP